MLSKFTSDKGGLNFLAMSGGWFIFRARELENGKLYPHVVLLFVQWCDGKPLAPHSRRAMGGPRTPTLLH